MSSSRIVLIFLGIILMIIVILTSSKLAAALKSRIGTTGFAGIKFAGSETTPTPSPTLTTTKGGISSNPTGTVISGKVQYPTGTSTQNTQSPATGPTEVAYFIIGGSAGLGYLLTKFSSGRK